jgi:alginate O-acetyltransferase complex protein AlgF
MSTWFAHNASRVLTTAAVAVLALWTAPALSAQSDGGVYGPQAPQNAGFVRLVHGAAGRGTVELPVGPLRLGPIGFGEATPYRPLRAGISVLRSGAAEAELIVRPDSYTTVILTREGFSVITDERHTDPARAQLVLYNATDLEPASLIVAPDGPPVIEGVAEGAAAPRAVNAVTVDLAVRAAGTVAARLGALRLTRGDSFAVFLLEGPDGATARVHQAEVVVGE